MKKFLSVLLILLVLASLTGCGTEKTSFKEFEFEYPSNWEIVENWESYDYYNDFKIKSNKNTSTDEGAYNIEILTSNDFDIVSACYNYQKYIYKNTTELDTGIDYLHVY